MTRTITRNGQKVYCYGVWSVSSNAHCVFEDEAYDGVVCPDAKTWTEIVEEMTAYAKRMGTAVLEISAI